MGRWKLLGPKYGQQMHNEFKEDTKPDSVSRFWSHILQQLSLQNGEKTKIRSDMSVDFFIIIIVYSPADHNGPSQGCSSNYHTKLNLNYKSKTAQ